MKLSNKSPAEILVTILLAVIIGFIPVGLIVIVLESIKKTYLYDLFFIVISAFILVVVLFISSRVMSLRNEIAKKEKSINELIEGERYAGFDDLIISRIERASEQQELMMVNSRGRGVLLFWLGIILIGLSLSGPIVAAYTYYCKEPSTKETIREFVDLKKEIGEIPKEISLSLNRDWHLLLGGITFGFLCLAASRGILAQQANEMKTYFELGQRARYFDRLKSVVEILSKQDRRKSKLEKEIFQLVIDKLLNEFPNKDANEGGGEPKETSVDKSIVSETVKEAASRLQTS